MKDFELYNGGQLEESEFLLKIREEDNTGFMTKLTQKGEVPVKFSEWNNWINYNTKKDAIHQTRTISN